MIKQGYQLYFLQCDIFRERLTVTSMHSTLVMNEPLHRHVHCGMALLHSESQ